MLTKIMETCVYVPIGNYTRVNMIQNVDLTGYFSITKLHRTKITVIYKTSFQVQVFLVDIQLVKKLFAHPRKDPLFHYLLFNQRS